MSLAVILAGEMILQLLVSFEAALRTLGTGEGGPGDLSLQGLE